MGRFFLLVLALGFLEVFLLVKVAGTVGFFGTVGLCVLTGMIGGALVRHQGLQTVRTIQVAMSKGEPPAVEIVNGLLLLVAGALLIVPGFITDAVGFLALIPSLRRRGAAWLAARLTPPSFRAFPSGPRRPGRGSGRIIDVEPDD